MFHFDRVLKEGEKIVWAGTPRLGPYLLSGTLLLYLFIAFGLALIMAALFAPAYQGTSASDAYNRLFFIGFGLACMVPVFIVMFKMASNHKFIAYAVTTERLLFQRAGEGKSIDMVSIPFGEVKDMQLNQGIVDMLFGGGTKSVLFSTPDSYSHHYKYGWQYKPKRFEHVERAEEVLKAYQAHQPGSRVERVVTLPSLEPAVSAITALAADKVSPFLPRSEHEIVELDADLTTRFRNVLKPGERPLWRGKPKARPFVFSYLPLYILSLVSIGFSIYNASWRTASEFSDFVAYAAGIAFLTIAPIIYRLLAYSHTAYLVTDQRVLVQGGVIGQDVESFEREQITDVKIVRGGLDWLLARNTATVILETYNRRNMAATSIWWKGNELEHIADADKVYQLLQPQPATVVGDRNSASFVPLPSTK